MKYSRIKKGDFKFKLEVTVREKAEKAFTFKSLKQKYKKYFSISKDGEITIKKGTKKGVYRLKIRVTTKETANYMATTRVQEFTIRIK